MYRNVETNHRGRRQRSTDHQGISTMRSVDGRSQRLRRNTTRRIMTTALLVMLSGGITLGSFAPAAAATAPLEQSSTYPMRVEASAKSTLIKKLVAAIKRFGPRVWNACVRAVRGGYGAFKRWFDGLPWYIRIPIRAVSPLLTVYDIYTLLNEVI